MMNVSNVLATQHVFVLNGRMFNVIPRNLSRWTKGHLDLYEIDIIQNEIYYRTTWKNILPKLEDKKLTFSVIPYIGPKAWAHGSNIFKKISVRIYNYFSLIVKRFTNFSC